MVLLLRAVFGLQVASMLLTAVVIYMVVKLIQSRGGDEHERD